MGDPDRPRRGRVAGIDFGTKRIGIAVSNADRTVASPYENYTRRDPAQDARRFQRLIQEETITQFVVGLPVHLSGQESEKSLEARRFAAWLGEVTGISVVLFDERFTSAEAEALLQMGELTKKRRQARRDMLAAQILLAAYLESGGRGTIDPGPLS